MSVDEYDEQHQETGSGNISKATPEWKEILRQARLERGPDELVLHKAYALVNEQGLAGCAWAKCPNCGSPYRADLRGNVCSDDCYREYLAYVTNS